MGDPIRILLLETLVKVIERDNLLENVRTQGDYVLSGVKELAVSEGVEENQILTLFIMITPPSSRVSCRGVVEYINLLQTVLYIECQEIFSDNSKKNASEF